MTLRSEVARAMSLDTLRYSAVWEDHRLLEGALDLGPGDDVLCIGSAGDNALALLLQDPASVTALDMSPAQAALIKLKLAALADFDRWEELAALIGLIDGDPLALYERLRPRLDDQATGWLDAHADDVAAGLLHRGRLEAYFAAFREQHLERLWPDDLMDRMLATDLAGQRAIFEREADTPAFAAAFADFFGRENMERQGRDPAQFAHVAGGDPGRYFHRRASWAFRAFPLSDNPYVVLLLVNLLMLVFGMFLDIGAAILILTPLLMPRVTGLGVDPVHFGIVVVVNLMLGGLTPPVGMLAFITGTISRTPVHEVFRALVPLLAALFAALLVITYVPAVSLGLGSLIGGR